MNSKKKLIDRLSEAYPASSKTQVKEWIVKGRVDVNGKTVSKPHVLVEEEDKILLVPRRKIINRGLEILFEDPYFIAINKPSGLLSVATDFEKEATALAILKERFGSNGVHVVHRLDRDTSGVMLFAKTKDAQQKLKKIFENHALYREYRAVVHGRFEKKEGTFKCYLTEGDDYVVRPTTSSKKGELAVTHYRVLKAKKELSLVKFVLETGKKNQIRVHCQMNGHPILGDKKYGEEGDRVKRLCLHAHILAFNHPYSGKNMRFSSPVPSLFENLR